MNPDDLIARYGIANALAMHSRGVDRADFNLLSAAYHPDATVDYGFFEGEAATLVSILAEAQKPSLPTLHRTSNIWIKLEGQHAISESYVIAYVEDAETQRLVFGRYLDRHEERAGEWRLVHRTYLLDGNTNRPTTVARADPPVAHDNFVPQGGKGAADPGRALLAHHQASSRLLHGAKPMSADPSALDATLSRAAIHDLAMAYCRGVDRGDADLLRSIFWEDSAVISGIINGTGAEFADQITDFCTQNLDYCFHSVANEWVEVKGDHAVGEHYVVAQMTMGGNDVMTGGRYIDSYERRNGVWKIKSRTFVNDWNTTHPTTLQKDGFYEALKNWGRFGKDDPVYGHWASQ
jgi:SnoaL-like domain